MKKLSLMMLIILILFISLALPVGTIWADEETDDPVGDESATFASVAADALIVLDLSGSMAFGPPGSSAYYGNSASCTADTTNCAGSGCSDGFCGSSKAGCNVNCSRLAIAKKGIFGILDDDNNNTIDSSDSASLGIRIGFMRFKATNPPDCDNGNDTAGDHTKGGIKLITKVSELGKETGTSYSLTYCGNSTSCASTVTSCTSGECIAGENACGGTPLASSLSEAKTYLAAHKDKDTSAKACRQKFVILLTDGADTYACSGAGNECQENMYERRREVVAATKALYNAGYKVFVIGFGSTMPPYLVNTLEWAAYYGGTDNSFVVNSGDTTAYNIPSGSTFPSGVSSCASSSDSAADCCRDNDAAHSCGGLSRWNNQTHFRTTANDPGYLNLSGYAFIATNASELSDALRAAIATIRDQAYSFTRVSVQTVRTMYENYIYEASFLPLIDIVNDPFWIGHLKRYPLNEDGTLKDSDWDAGTILQARTGSTRTIYTYKGGSLVAFNTVTAADLGVTSTATRDGIVNFIYNGELDTTYAYSGWKLGDIFHSSPISVGSPSPFFNDIISPAAYDAYRAANQRTSENGKRLIVAGANDGQFHVFKTGNLGVGGGTELWSFVPPNLLPRLQGLYHTAHPTSLSHQYFVDGPATASDIWTGTGDGTSKTLDQWKAYLIISEGRGGSTLWSSSPYCDSDFSATYSAGYNQYCGYYAFDVTDTISAPVFKWHFGGTGGLSETQGKHLGQPWSKITMGRVKISGQERWVGFAPGGYAGTNCKGGGSCDTRGKGFYVIDLLTGNVLWTFTHSDTNGMDYSLVGQPASVDTDDDGYIDTVYSADLGGNVWRFKLCAKAEIDASSCTSESNWTGGLFFDSSSGTIRPIYTKPTVVHSLNGDLWVYFGTGDLNDPTASNAQEKMYAVKDNSRSGTYGVNNLSNITSEGNTYDPSSDDNGWYINLSGGGQKILADPIVYANVVYFTSYTPGNINDRCDTSGDSNLNAVNYVTGAGQFEDGARSTYAGKGIASGAVVSENPYGGTNIYVSTSEGAKINAVQPPDPTANRANLQYWHDMRVQ